jgi:arabinogalactan oligomer/maltooligosaccharide transport system permease protein
MLLFLAAALAGEVTLWHAWRGDERAALDEAVATWNAAHPEQPVQPIFVPYEGLAAKVDAAVPHGNGPDLFIFGHERVAEWAALGIVHRVEPDGGFLPVGLAALDVDGSPWGWPLAAKSLALFRNTALVPEAPATSEALLAVAAAQTQGDRFGFAWETASAYQNAAWMHGFGGGVFAGGRVQLDRPENAAALAFVVEAARFGPADPTGALVTQLFNEGRAAMVLNGPWFLGEVDPAVPFAVSPLPTVSATGRPAAPYVTVEALFLARDNPDALPFAAWFAGPAGGRVRQDVGHQVVARTDVPARLGADGAPDPVAAAFTAQLAAGVPMPTDPDMAKTWEPLARSMRRLARGATTPEQAVAEAQTEFTIVTRPPPAPADARPWLGGLAAAALVGAGLGLRGLRQASLRPWLWVLPWILPAFAAMTLLVMVPFLVGATVAFFETDGQSWSFVGLAHFVDILLARDFPLTSPLSFWSTLFVTVGWTVANLVLHVTVGVALALLLREPWVRLRGAFRAALILPWAVPSYITALIWKGMFHRQFGAINAILVALGAEPVSWFGSFATAFAANLTTNTWLGFPFMMVVTLGALSAIPRELEEAAEVEGAGWWTRFRHITLPLLKPALMPAIVLGSVWTFNQFNVIYLVSAGEPDGSTDILVSQAYRWAFTRGHRYGYAAAYALLIFGVLVLYGLAANRLAGRKVV